MLCNSHLCLCAVCLFRAVIHSQVEINCACICFPVRSLYLKWRERRSVAGYAFRRVKYASHFIHIAAVPFHNFHSQIYGSTQNSTFIILTFYILTCERVGVYVCCMCRGITVTACSIFAWLHSMLKNQTIHSRN